MALIRIIIVFTAFLLTSVCFSGNQAIHVVFINPGSVKDIGVWHLTSNFMQAAADDLGIQLEVIYSDRNHIKMMDQVSALSKRPVQPDYVVIVNEKQTGDNMLASLKASHAKILLIHNDLSQKQRQNMGIEREQIKNWIGTIVTDEHKAGYLEIEQLCQQRNAEPKIVAITGNKVTPVSNIRVQGLLDYRADSNSGEIYQVVYGKWSYDDGKSKARGLLNRHPDTNIIWAANDSMALGALDAIKEQNREDQVIVGGLGGFPDAIKSIKEGGLNLTVAGHPMIGAWALLLLFDYHHGYDFISDIGLNYKVNHLTVIDTKEKADQYSRLVLTHPNQIDFRFFSKALNKNLVKYDFSYENVVNAATPKGTPGPGP